MSVWMMGGIAIGLSMDAVAVSISDGCMAADLKLRHALRTALFFGVFQAVMPLIGWAVGLGFRAYIQGFDHWVAFGMLAFVGGKMIWDSAHPESQAPRRVSSQHLPTLLLLSVATSIDALAVGVSFAMLDQGVLVPVLVIGVVTFVNCVIGARIGTRAGHLLQDRCELVGGAVLILIGLKILVEHLFFGV